MWVAKERLEGRDYDPLRVISIHVTGTDVVLQTNRRTLVADTVTVPAQPNHGFAVENAASGRETITSVTVGGNGEIVLSCANTPQAGWKVLIGADAAVEMAPYAGAATNIRSDRVLTNTVAYDAVPSDPVHEWLCVEELDIAESSPGPLTVKTITANYVLTDADLSGGAYIIADVGTAAAPITVTVPDTLTGRGLCLFEIEDKGGAGHALTFAASGGASLRAPGAQLGATGDATQVSLIPRGGDTYTLQGTTQ